MCSSMAFLSKYGCAISHSETRGKRATAASNGTRYGKT